MVGKRTASALVAALCLVSFSLISCSSQQPGPETGTGGPVASAVTPTSAVGSAAAASPAGTASAAASSTSPTPVPTKAPRAATPSAASAPTVALPTATPTATPAPTEVPPTPTQVVAKQKGKVVLGYYVSYDTTSWMSLQAHADALDYVALQVVSPDACGNIATQDDLTLLEFAHSRGIGVLPSIFTSNRWLNHQILTSEAASSRLVQQLTDYVVEEGYDGLDVDLEDVEPTDRKALTTFVALLSESLHGQGKMLTMAVPAKPSDVTTGWAGAYDYAALAPHVDLFTIMSYAYTTSVSPPGSTAPLPWVDKVTAFATSQIPPHKVLVGVPFWGYDWNTTVGGRARALRYPQAAALAAQYGADIATDPSSKSAKFTYVAKLGDQPPSEDKLPPLNHVVKQRTQPPCPLKPPTPTPGPTQPPKPTPTPAAIQEHVVWLEDAASVQTRLDLAERHSAGGIGAWRLGQEDPQVWPLLQAWGR